MGTVAANGETPGGIRVRFKRFGAATKAFIERAVQAKSASGQPERKSTPEAERPSAPEAERPSEVQNERVSMPEVRASMTELETLAVPPMPAPAHDSGLRQRVPGPVAAPANREELLARLRQRRQTG